MGSEPQGQKASRRPQSAGALSSAWKFFASLKLAVVLLVLLALASALGTFVPQGGTAEDYQARFGSLGRAVLFLQLDHAYSSVWFIGLLGLFAVNLVVCTLSRFSPKWRRLARPSVREDQARVKAMRWNATLEKKASLEETFDYAVRLLVGARYRVRSSREGGRAFLLARRNGLGWFGPDLVHLGLLVILGGGISSGLLATRSSLALAEGETAAVPRAGFSVRLDRFETEYYPGGGVKDWKSSLTVIDNGRAAAAGTVEVNHPLRYRGFNFYQSGYGRDWSAAELEVEVRKKNDPAFSRRFTVKPGGRFEPGDADVTRVELRSFVPDFVLGEGNRVMSRSDEPRNPAALIEAFRGEGQVFQGWVFANYPDFQGMKRTGDSPVLFYLRDFRAAQYSVVEAARDPGAPVIWAGCAVLMLGLALAFYRRPSEIRVFMRESGGRVELTAGGLSHGNRERFRSEFEAFTQALRRS
jgi:cytochrome c biogenesis protein